MAYVFVAQINYFDIQKITHLLQKKKIDFFIKDIYNSYVSAGWVTPGMNFNEQALYVDEDEINTVKKLISTIL